MEQAEILPKKLLIVDLQKRFKKFNRDTDIDEIDWSEVVPSRSTFGEGLETMERNYPQYEWGNGS